MNFYSTYISDAAKENVLKVLSSTFISSGIMADKFENELSEKLGLINPVSLNSGTSALHLALEVAGVKQGDEVILPAQTFIATGLAVLMTGAKPVFADIQYETGNLDPFSFKSRISDRTKAVIPVHWAGYPCDLDEINEIAKEFNIVVIEDAAHALGATYKKRPIGSISRLTVFSFQAIKHLTTGDGGALCCLQEDDWQNARRRRWFDIDRENALPSILGEREYDASEVGYKYHMNDIAAALGLGNLEDIHRILRYHREIGLKYRKELRDVQGLELLSYQNDRESAFWIFTVLVEKRENFIRALKGRGIPTSVVHLRIDKNSVFGGINHDLVNQEKFNSRQVALPVHNQLSDEDVDKIINAIKAGW